MEFLTEIKNQSEHKVIIYLLGISNPPLDMVEIEEFSLIRLGTLKEINYNKCQKFSDHKKYDFA